jgi:hypothetical protein
MALARTPAERLKVLETHHKALAQVEDFYQELTDTSRREWLESAGHCFVESEILRAEIGILEPGGR